MTSDELNRLLEARYGGGSGNTFYFGLISAAGFVGTDPADTMASHPGWTEFTGYSGNRPQWVPGAAAAGSILNPTRAQVTTTAAGSVVGVFVTTSATKGGTAGNLVGAPLLIAPQDFGVGVILKLRNTKTARAA